MNLRLSHILLPLLLTGAARGQTPSLDFISQGGAELSFQASSGSLSVVPDPKTGFDIQIANAPIPKYGLFGTITGPIGVGPAASGPGGEQAYSLTGVSQISIYDGTSAYLTGEISWTDASGSTISGTLVAQPGLTADLVSYSGANAELRTIANEFNAAGSADVSINLPGLIASLAAQGGNPKTPFSGLLSVIPESPAWGLIAGSAALLGAFALRGRRRGGLAA
jgi:hypothetical protein